MRLGKAYSVYIPGESFIQYQLNTQAIRPDNFVAMAAYAEELGYIGNRDAITTDRPAPRAAKRRNETNLAGPSRRWSRMALTVRQNMVGPPETISAGIDNVLSLSEPPDDDTNMRTNKEKTREPLPG